MPRCCVAVCFLSFLALSLSAAAGPPTSLDPRIKIELFASEPRVVTPTGLDVDHRGRVWVIESNTHFPPEGYNRHPTDRLLVMSDTTGDGRADKIVTFTDGLTHTMSVAVRSTGEIIVVTRREILVYRDADNDLKPDAKPKRIILLDTTGNYPHNGLAGLAFDALGWMYFGIGENLGADYKLIGTDGATLTGGGEGGNVYRCRLDGTKLAHQATGFWNPHASCVDAFGRLFSVDNDPDSRPPCRLLHIIPGGDYGYRFRNGRRGIHPFTAWDGELPGTLPMVAGTGEAPSGIVAYESDGLPREYIGNLLVTSWGDHRIDRFRLIPKGTSFTSKAEPIIKGGENFRPVGLAVAPDGSLFCTDWVLKEYKVHGKGRVWRISMVDPPKRKVVDVTTIAGRGVDELKRLLNSPRVDVRRAAVHALVQTEEGRRLLLAVVTDGKQPKRIRLEIAWLVELALEGPVRKNYRTIPFDFLRSAFLIARNGTGGLREFLFKRESRARMHLLLASDPEGTPFDFSKHKAIHDPFVFRTFVNAVTAHLRMTLIEKLADPKLTRDVQTRMIAVLAARRKNPQLTKVLALALKDPETSIRRTAVQWIGEEKLNRFRPQLEAVLSDGAVTTELFEAVLASLEMLDGVKRKSSDEWAGSQYVLTLLVDKQRPAAVRARALRMLPPEHKGLTAKLIENLLAVNDKTLTRETVRTLQHSPLPQAPELLQSVAADETNNVALRAEAILGLASAARNNKRPNTSRRLLLDLLQSDKRALQIESLRSLRGLAGSEAEVKTALLQLAERLRDRRQKPALEERELVDQLAMALTRESKELPGHLADLMTPRPGNSQQWLKSTKSGGNPAAGRRAFFHANSSGCYRCHTVNGRGGRIGPDLSLIARTMDRRKLAESILEPSKEVAPQFVAWTLATKKGKVHSGLILSETREGTIRLGTAEGTVVEFSAAQIDQRTQQKTSLMPQKLIDGLTVGEFRDLLAFLRTLR